MMRAGILSVGSPARDRGEKAVMRTILDTPEDCEVPLALRISDHYRLSHQ